MFNLLDTKNVFQNRVELVNLIACTPVLFCNNDWLGLVEFD